MNYNDFTYYRANPYARQGYMPPIAHVNRHKPQFLTQLPMGQQHLSKMGKKQYGHGVQRSNIQSQNILKSPQRYPFENRIALQKTYERNLNTIDIEGASSGTMMSQAVKNKFKARQQLIRRQKQAGSNHFEQLQHLQNTEQQKRRQIAYQQYQRNQQIQQLNSGRLYKLPTFETIPGNEGYRYRNNLENPNLQISQSQQIPKQRQIPHNRNPERYTRTPQKPNQPQQIPRYQSIDMTRLSSNPESQQYHYQNQQKAKGTNNMINQMQMSESQVLNDGNVNNSRFDQDRVNNIDRRQFRQQNPTVLSSENSIYLAGRNIIGS